MPVYTKRIYELSRTEPGYRILVDRIWPRGVKREDLKLDEWLKTVSPTNDLRNWFSHDVAKWQEFRERYKLELANHADQLDRIRKLSKDSIILLLYSTKDKLHNQAIVLKEIIEGHPES